MMDFRKRFLQLQGNRIRNAAEIRGKKTYNKITSSSRGETEEVDQVHPTPEDLRIQPFRQDEYKLTRQNFTKLQEEVKKLCKENTDLTELIKNGLQDTLDLKVANQERQINTL